MDLGQKQTLQFCYRNIEIKLLPIAFCFVHKSISSSVIIRIAFSCNNSEKYRHPIWQHAEIERPWNSQLLILCLHEISPIRPQGTWWKRRQKIIKDRRFGRYQGNRHSRKKQQWHTYVQHDRTCTGLTRCGPVSKRGK